MFIVENFKLLSVSVHVHKECMLYFVLEMWHFIFCLPHTYSLNQFRALDKREHYKIGLGYFFYYFFYENLYCDFSSGPPR